MKCIHVIERDNFTDLYKQLQSDLKNEGLMVYPRDMPSREIMNVNLVLTNPRQRLLYSRVRKHSYTYAAAEFLWYMSADNRLDFMTFYLPKMADYSDDGLTVNSGYGNRIFGNHEDFPDQWLNVVMKLKEDTNTRQAVITVHYQHDLDKPTKDVPCTLNLHFMIRKNELNLFVQMRSNDAYMGLIYDTFAFTLLQEHMLNCLKIIDPELFLYLELGTYVHKSNSMHLYERNLEGVKNLLAEDIRDFPVLPESDLILYTGELSHLMLDERKLRRDGQQINSHVYSGICKFMANKLNRKLEK